VGRVSSILQDPSTNCSLWQLVLVLIAIRTRNTVQVAAVTMFNFALLGYAVIQVSDYYRFYLLGFRTTG
jgi:hypothetical protein